MIQQSLVDFVKSVIAGKVDLARGAVIDNKVVELVYTANEADPESIAAEAINREIVAPSIPWDKLVADVKAAMKSAT